MFLAAIRARSEWRLALRAGTSLCRDVLVSENRFAVAGLMPLTASP